MDQLERDLASPEAASIPDAQLRRRVNEIADRFLALHPEDGPEVAAPEAPLPGSAPPG